MNKDELKKMDWLTNDLFDHLISSNIDPMENRSTIELLKTKGLTDEEIVGFLLGNTQ